MNTPKTNEELQTLIDKENEVYQQLLLQYHSIDRKLNVRRSRMDKYRTQMDQNIIDEYRKSEKIDWEWVLGCSLNESTVRYKFAHEVIDKMAGIIYSGCHNGKTNQLVLIVSVKKGSSDEHLQKIKASLDFVMDYLLPDEDGWVHFSVSEITCGEHGVYYFLFKKDKSKIKISKYVHHSERYSWTFTNVMDALKYIREHLSNNY